MIEPFCVGRLNAFAMLDNEPVKILFKSRNITMPEFFITRIVTPEPGENANFDRLKKQQGERFILVFTVNDEVGALAKAVNVICAHGFNMRVLRSRPVKNIPWQYYFYVEADGDRHGDESKKMIKELSACCETLKVSGSYEYDKII